MAYPPDMCTRCLKVKPDRDLNYLARNSRASDELSCIECLLPHELHRAIQSHIFNMLCRQEYGTYEALALSQMDGDYLRKVREVRPFILSPIDMQSYLTHGFALAEDGPTN